MNLDDEGTTKILEKFTQDLAKLLPPEQIELQEELDESQCALSTAEARITDLAASLAEANETIRLLNKKIAELRKKGRAPATTGPLADDTPLSKSSGLKPALGLIYQELGVQGYRLTNDIRLEEALRYLESACKWKKDPKQQAQYLRAQCAEMADAVAILDLIAQRILSSVS